MARVQILADVITNCALPTCLNFGEHGFHARTETLTCDPAKELDFGAWNKRTSKVKISQVAAAGVLALPTVLGTGAAHAATVSVNSTAYNLTTDFINYGDNIALLQAQAWWGNAAPAKDLALASANLLQTPKTGYQYDGGDDGALFADKTILNGGLLQVAIAVFNLNTGLVEIDDMSF